MLSPDVRKEIEALNALSEALEALHKIALKLLESSRRAAGKCVACGKDVSDDGDEYCEECFNEWMKEKMQEEKHPDNRGA